jgi:hypothetical protein
MTSRRRNLLRPGVAQGLFGAGIILSLVLSVAPAASQAIPSWNRECRKLLKQYETKPRHKAFAASSPTSASAQQSCASAWGYPSKAAAEADAKARCRKEDGGGTCWIKISE